MSVTKPPDWVGTPEVQELLAKAIAAELRRLADQFAKTDPNAEMLVNRGFRQAANVLRDRATELDNGR